MVETYGIVWRKKLGCMPIYRNISRYLEHSLTKVYTDAKDIILPLELLLSIFHSMKSLIFCRGRKKEEGRGGAAGEVG